MSFVLVCWQIENQNENKLSWAGTRGNIRIRAETKKLELEKMSHELSYNSWGTSWQGLRWEPELIKGDQRPVEEQQYFVLPQHLLYAPRQKVWYDIICSGHRCTAQYYRERGGSAQIMGKNKQPAVARSMLGCLIVSHTSPYYDKWATSPIQCNASKIWMLQHFQKAIDENAPFFPLLLLLLVLSQFTNYIIAKVSAWAAWWSLLLWQMRFASAALSGSPTTTSAGQLGNLYCHHCSPARFSN